MSTPLHFALFSTPLGSCGVAWTERGIRRVWLEGGEASARALGASIAIEAQPPAAVQRGIEAIRALAEGQPFDLAGLPLDMEDLPRFHRKVYEAARRIPPGETTTYGQLAAQLGSPGGARAVGQALAKNPFLLLIPCHRIVSASGKLGGFSAHGGVATKERLLSMEREQKEAGGEGGA